MQKIHIILLSSLIACTSRGMQCENLKDVSDILRYGAVSADEFSDIYAVEQEIKKGVAELQKANQLTQETVLAKIESALKPYASKPNILPEFQTLYKHNDKVVVAEVHTYSVHKYDVNTTGSLVALLFGDDNDISRRVGVYAEASRGTWKQIREQRFIDVKYIYLIDSDNETILAKLNSQNEASFEHLGEGRCSSLENLQSALRKRHEENIKFSFGGWNNMRGCVLATRLASEKSITVKDCGLEVHYKPTLQEIAQYLVTKAQQANSK